MIYRSHVLVCAGTGCTSSHSLRIIENFHKKLEETGYDKEVQVIRTGCFGLCAAGPVVVVYPEGIYYSHVKPEDVEEIVNEHIIKGRPVQRLIYKEHDESGVNTTLNDSDFYKKQHRIALRNCGMIDPENIDEYIAFDGYKALGKVLTEMTRDEVVDTIIRSGLRGRGGGGFPTGLKWKFAKAPESDVKYVCCNADEGDPGAFMDRSVLEGDPHSVLEAMTIAGYAIGAQQGYIYVRAEYPIAVKRLRVAIGQAREYGLLGDNIMGTGFKFDIDLRLGSGAFVCGEETALLASIEGGRGEPRPRPPFPAVKGLFGKPTLLNNVETYANVPWIINHGAAAYAAYGTEDSKGDRLRHEAFDLLKDTKEINFIGNVETRDVPYGCCDVLVADGFTGNIILKLYEGVAGAMMANIKSIFKKSSITMLAAMMVKGGLLALKVRMDYSEFGGAPLLGVNGVVIKAHGSSDAKAIRNAIKQAKTCAEKNIVGTIAQSVRDAADAE